ncbi:fumarylacetoacetate hydrolase family protein [Hydrogenibacillus schlegelii]|nr:fumarylacetoacetate hydrolase family protein [Hydrogenibacillus schlegelii]OAR03194.1 hypothetical protein SA87_04680 [Hydrogenibacillus schlegelii]
MENDRAAPRRPVRAYARPVRRPLVWAIDVDPDEDRAWIDGEVVRATDVVWDLPVRGTVYGLLLNTVSQWTAFQPKMTRPPYEAPPSHPVLYVKPPNTLLPTGGTVALDPDVDVVAVGVTVGAVFARPVFRATPQMIDAGLLGYVIVGDLFVPHDDFFRPPFRTRARDGFTVLGPWVVDRTAYFPDVLRYRIWIDGREAATGEERWVRPPADVLASVSAFMTLAAGDVLLLGTPYTVPLARPGQSVALEVEGLGRSEFTVGRRGEER